MNKVILIGRLTRDVELGYCTNDSNTAFARYTLAIDRPHKRDGQQETDFIRCLMFGRTAELADRYLAKGMKVAVEGRIQTGSYTNREGQMVYTTDVLVERQEFLQRKKSSNSQPDPGSDAAENSGDGFMDIPDGIEEELPFN